ncbi:MAG: beta-ketoacyl-[acyl-carrier-protein] synthase family protein [Planctomycetota bacterium]|nr:beta-ketoacyl-[acyl-carrier-protein] synthase family protein [Planctomycetota bacterium]
MAKKEYRVVVTGLGVVSPLGCRYDSFSESLFAGRSGVKTLSLFSPASFPTKIVAEVGSGFNEHQDIRDRKIRFALAAAQQAMDDACRNDTNPGLEAQGQNAALSLGIGLELFAMEDLFEFRASSSFVWPEGLRDRLCFLQTPSDLCLHWISERHGLKQAPVSHVSACAAGTDALGHAFRWVRSGRRRWALAGGADSMINPLGLGGFCKLNAMSTRNDDPERASRPFDKDRDGFVLGEGSAFLVMERLEDAQARGAKIYGEICGYGNSFDAHGISEPHPEGKGALSAMSRALKSAGLTPESVDFINAHGTSTPKNDPVETMAIKNLLGERGASVPVLSTKSMTGHLIAAAGALEAVAVMACFEQRRLHPTINLVNPDESCDLDYVPEGARDFEGRVALSNSFGFGGQNASIVLRAFEGVRGRTE